MAANYDRLELLGSGSYGKAWLVSDAGRKKRAVLKEIRLDILSEKEMSQALVEVKVLARCRHVNIVSYHEAFVGAGCLNIVMEYADGGDLQKRILDQKGIHFDNEIILDWFIQICFALKYLHSENILHRDLKPQNLFLTSDGIVKVGDFGISRILQDTADHAVTAIGTPYYLSPEICQRKPYNAKSDMWSLGCVLYELCCLRVPFNAQNLPLLVLKILDAHTEPLPSHCGPVLEDLVSVLLKTSPSERPSAVQVLNVPVLLPYVKTSYRKCTRHKEERQRKKSMSSLAPSDSELKTPRAEREQCSPNQQTYTVRSPLVRRLSVATPKLKAAIKRQRAAHSAEATPAVKNPRKGNPPSLDLLQKVMQSSPLPHNRHHLPCEDISNREGPDDGHQEECGRIMDDVFEDKPQINFAEKDKGKWYPGCRNKTKPGHLPAEGNTPGRGHKCDKNVDLKTEDVCCQPMRKRTVKKVRSDSTGCTGNGEYVDKADGGFTEGGPPENSIPAVQQGINIPSSTTASCGLGVKKQHSRADTADVNSPQLGGRFNQRVRKSKVRSCADLKSASPKVCAKQFSAEIEHRTSRESTTYSIDQPRNIQVCSCFCDKNELLSHQCMLQTLYRAAALGSQNEKQAKHVLLKYLQDQLGTERCHGFLSTVQSALQIGLEFSALDGKLDKDQMSYLPIVLQLLMINERK